MPSLSLSSFLWPCFSSFLASAQLETSLQVGHAALAEEDNIIATNKNANILIFKPFHPLKINL